MNLLKTRLRAEILCVRFPFHIPKEFSLLGTFIFFWTGLVTAAVLFNLWTVIAREAFGTFEFKHGNETAEQEYTEASSTLFNSWAGWAILDRLADLIYLVDLYIHCTLSFYDHGLLNMSPAAISAKYMQSSQFYLDIFSLFPMEQMGQLYFQCYHPILRFNRFLKVYRALDWSRIVEQRISYPNLWRIIHFEHLLFLFCHYWASFYYMISMAKGFASPWGYPKPEGEWGTFTRKYLICFRWAFMTLTTISDVEQAQDNIEYADHFRA